MRTRVLFTAALMVWTLALCVTARSSPEGLHYGSHANAVVVQAFRPAVVVQALRPALPATPDLTNDDCLTCHGEETMVRADGRPVVVKRPDFAASVHAAMSCTDCHTDVAGAQLPHAEKLAKVDCSSCHPEPVEKYSVSAHAKARANGATVAATCVDCHGMHDIKGSKDPGSRTYHLTVAATCSRCHGNAEIIAKGKIPSDVTKAFGDSIHGRALSRSGLIVAPTCSDCHGAHDIRPPQDPQSSVAKAHVPATCGKCHEGIQHQFGSSTHGQMLARGTDGGPACQTCHTAHGIQRAESVGWQLSVIGQCGTCHADRVATFRDTFHGQVTALGFRTVAGCADCHGAHEILPASDPRSPISKGRLVQTCGKCHENANENFVQYDPHADKHDRQRSPILYYTTKFMTVLLAGVFGFFGLHTTMWFSKELRLKQGRRKGSAK